MDMGTGSAANTSERTCKMIMTFHAGHCERILWSGWVAYTVTEFVFSALAFFVLAFAYEALKFGREVLLRKAIEKENDQLMALQSKLSSTNEGCCSNTPLNANPQTTWRKRIISSTHIIQSLLNLIQIVISYLLMLVFMNYNYWLCLAIVLGMGLGYFCFGWIKQEKYDTECCN